MGEYHLMNCCPNGILLLKCHLLNCVSHATLFYIAVHVNHPELLILFTLFFHSLPILYYILCSLHIHYVLLIVHTRM